MKQKLIYAATAFMFTVAIGCGPDKGKGEGTTHDTLQVSTTPPYTIQLQEFVNPNLPDLHSYTHAVYRDKIIMIGGRTNGLHGGNYDFEQSSANKEVFVIDTKNWADPSTWQVHSMADSRIPFINKEQFRANNAQFFTDDEKGVLYIIGGLYGSNVHTKLKVAKQPEKGLEVVKPKGLLKGSDGKTASGPITLPYFTAVDLGALVALVMDQTPMPANAIRQVVDKELAATGGELSVMNGTVYLVFGWDFSIPTNGATGDLYTHKIKSFTYTDNGQTLSLNGPVTVCPTCWDGQNDSSNTGYYRRRDGSMSAMIDPADESQALVYYAGVFKNGNTNFDSPVWIGKNTAQEQAFVMRSNVYTCQVVPAYSKFRKMAYATMLGGMTNAIYNGGAITSPILLTDQNAPVIPEDTNNFTSVPFSNQFSTFTVSQNHTYGQYLLPDSFPATPVPVVFADTTLPAGSNTYNGAESELLWTLDAKQMYSNGVIDYDKFITANPKGGVVGYLHGGIQSVLPNLFFTAAAQLTVASNRIFAVKLVPLTEEAKH